MTRQEQSEAIVQDLKLIVSDAIFARMSLAEISAIEGKLRSLKTLSQPSASLDLALGYAVRMKAPRADRHELGNRLKDAIWGL